MTQPGLTLADLLARTGAQHESLRFALRDELQWGRVVLDGAGRSRLVPDAFDGARWRRCDGSRDVIDAACGGVDIFRSRLRRPRKMGGTGLKAPR